MAFALFESVLVTFVLIVIAFVLPVAWFGEGFAYKAPVPVLVGAFDVNAPSEFGLQRLHPHLPDFRGICPRHFSFMCAGNLCSSSMEQAARNVAGRAGAL